MIRVVQRRLIIPRGDTGTFSLPILGAIKSGDVAVFSIFDTLTRETVFEKEIELNGDEETLSIPFTRKDTINLVPKKYLWDVKIMDGEKEVTEPEEVGELVVKGPGVMVEYYKNPEATAEILKDGWLYTGDMAKRDKDGFIYLVDRKKDVIITGGENIYPVQIEDFLRKHDKIKDVAVIGLPDKRLGEITAAIIEFKEGMSASEDEINEFCFDLPRYKRPKKIIFAKVPRNATGKIEKPKLRQIYCGKSLVEMQTTE